MVTAKLAHPLIQLSHLFTGEGAEGLVALVAEGRLIYVSSFSSPSNDFVGLPGLEIVSCIKDNNLKEAPGVMEHLGARSRLLLGSSLTRRPNIPRIRSGP